MSNYEPSGAFDHDAGNPLTVLAMLEACLPAVKLPDCIHCPDEREAIPIGRGCLGSRDLARGRLPTARGQPARRRGRGVRIARKFKREVQCRGSDLSTDRAGPPG